ncbi:MAG: ubiquinone/menaquinone biosynthesis methyltransferase, partial [Janthinobacterium lividum]
MGSEHRELADLAKRPEQVSAMFDDVAERYDRTNDILSAGQDRLWRRAVVQAVDARPGETVLDLAAGTGRSSEPFADRGVRMVPCDFSPGMVQAGKRRRPDLDFVVGDATRLPFADGVFDAATISFGLRNVVDPDAGLRELARVVRPGGRLVVCEFSTIPNPLLHKAYVSYLHHG